MSGIMGRSRMELVRAVCSGLSCSFPLQLLPQSLGSPPVDASQPTSLFLGELVCGLVGCSSGSLA